MISVGFTGTQEGMQALQFQALTDEVDYMYHFTHWNSFEFHHGDCIGADAEAHNLMERLHGVRIWVHPPEDTKKRAFCKGTNVVFLPAKPYIERNHDIVDACKLLVACPEGPERRRSGTWATVRYAQRIGKPVTIIMPDGQIGRVNQ